ncbi:SLAM family member 5-like [Pelobates cultripes]|nr:SLAM family member 5-like [Pelobates cultripes]
MSLVDYLSRIILISTSLELSGVFGITVCRNRYVSGEVGRNVTLHLDQTRITFATWEVCIGDGERHSIAHTYPGKPMEILDPRYTGRLNNTPDGSLIINQSENSDKVKPDTRRKTLYANLPCISKAKAFENLKSRSCRSRHVTGVEGESVTLPLDQSGITHATWELCTGERNIIATTFSEKTLNIQDRRYNGRLSSTPDGSLVISKLTKEDQSVYNTDMFVNQVYRCEQRYNLTVIKQSIRDMMSKPGTEQTVYADIPCPAKTFENPNTAHQNLELDFPCLPRDSGRKPNNEQEPHYRTVTIVRLSLSLCIFIIALCLLIHYIKTEVQNVKGTMRKNSIF